MDWMSSDAFSKDLATFLKGLLKQISVQLSLKCDAFKQTLLLQAIVKGRQILKESMGIHSRTSRLTVIYDTHRTQNRHDSCKDTLRYQYGRFAIGSCISS